MLDYEDIMDFDYEDINQIRNHVVVTCIVASIITIIGCVVYLLYWASVIDLSR